MKSARVFSQFVTHLTRKGLRQSSINNRLERLSLFFNHYKSLTLDNAEDLIQKFQVSGKSASYINNFIFAFRLYTRFLMENDQEHDERIFDIKTLNYDAPEKGILSDKEIEEIISSEPFPGQRIREFEMFRDLFKILAYTGCRPNEIKTLRIRDVDLSRNIFSVRPENSKTHDLRLVPICPQIRPIFIKLTSGKDPEDLLFSHHGKAISHGMDSYYFNTILYRLGIKRKNITLYSLRHSFITSLLNHGADMFSVQKIVGHKRASTTQNYTHYTINDIQDSIQKLSLISKKEKWDMESRINRLEDKLDQVLSIIKSCRQTVS